MTKINNIFMVGSMKDAEDAEAQKKTKIFAVLKCTNARFADGTGQKRLPFHEENLSLAFADDGSCPNNGWEDARSWLNAVAKRAKDSKRMILVCSDTGTGKAPRIVACHVGDWTVAGYTKAMKKMPRALKVKAMPEFDVSAKRVLK